MYFFVGAGYNPKLFRGKKDKSLGPYKLGKEIHSPSFQRQSY